MRDSIFLYINGKPTEISAKQVFQPLSDYLRLDAQATGTKVVCAEGDCGACTVLIGRVKNGDLFYQAVNSCIQYLYQLDGTHIVTVEGVKVNGELNAAQEAMVHCHGAQCGYCTPGIVMALSGLMSERKENPQAQGPCSQEIKDALTGNLCRCTGYEPILKAGCRMEDASYAHRQFSLPSLYPTQLMLAELEKRKAKPVLAESNGRIFFHPTTVAEATDFLGKYPQATLVSGGTDIGVVCNKRGLEPPVIMSLAGLSELSDIAIHAERLEVGGTATLSQLEAVVRDLVPELHQILVVFGAPQIKNAGTLAGNIANGSPIGDTLPFLMVMDAEVELTSSAGKRTVNMNRLYTGYRTLDKRPDELITRIHIPLPKPEERLKLYKVSKRKHLDISTFTAAILLRLNQGTIESARLAYGGVGPVVLRLPKTEAFLSGKTWSLDTMKEAGLLARSEITPISDVRGTDRYRYQLAENILIKCFHELNDKREAVGSCP